MTARAIRNAGGSETLNTRGGMGRTALRGRGTPSVLLGSAGWLLNEQPGNGIRRHRGPWGSDSRRRGTCCAPRPPPGPRGCRSSAHGVPVGKAWSRTRVAGEEALGTVHDRGTSTRVGAAGQCIPKGAPTAPKPGWVRGVRSREGIGSGGAAFRRRVNKSQQQRDCRGGRGGAMGAGRLRSPAALQGRRLHCQRRPAGLAGPGAD